MRETRATAISRHITLALTHSALTMETYAQGVVDLYRQRTPHHARGFEFRALGRNPYPDLRANAQIIRRMLDGQVRMATEIEEALVLALPEPFRAACLRELADRYGLLAAEKPATDGLHQQIQLADLVRETGTALAALAPMFDDGDLSAAVAPLAAKAMEELEDLESKITTIMAMVKSRTVAVAATPLRRVS